MQVYEKIVHKCNYHIGILWKLNYCRKYINEYWKKYIKKYNFRKKYSYLPYMWAKTKNICITWKVSFSWKKCKKNFFLMPLHQTDIVGFKSALLILPYGPLEPMVINFTCDFSLVCLPPRWPPLKMVKKARVCRVNRPVCLFRTTRKLNKGSQNWNPSGNVCWVSVLLISFSNPGYLCQKIKA